MLHKMNRRKQLELGSGTNKGQGFPGPGTLIYALLAAAVVLLLPGISKAQQGTITDDAFTSPNPAVQAVNLNGSGPTIIVSGPAAAFGQQQLGPATGYLKFKLTSSLPPGTTASNVAKATLKLYVTGIPGAGAINVYRLTSAWSESTLTPLTAPTLGSLEVSAVPVAKSNSFVVVDLTQLVKEWLGTDGLDAGGIPNHGIALVANTNATFVTFDSKESVVTSHEPRLELTLVSAGPQGAQGPVGATGPQGPKGDTGAKGPQGQQGVKGDTGATGAIGPQGSQGLKGSTGATGPQGLQGVQGPSGPMGPQGLKGDTGATGAVGAQGLTGPQGPQGMTFQGSYGAARSYSVNDAVSYQGATYIAISPTTNNAPLDPAGMASPFWSLVAARGETGSQGLQGPQGSVGPQGATGPPGQPGSTGPAGPQGPAGLNWRGAWDSTASYATNDAVSYQGSSWVATSATQNVTPGVGSIWTTLAEQGAAGAVGPAGVQGAQGPAGTEGAQGLTGPKGDAGVAGPIGPAGATGPQGLAGPQGPEGPQGPAGTGGPDLRLIATLRWDQLPRGYGDFGVGVGPTGVVFDGENIWVANFGSNTVTKLRARDGVNLGTFEAGHNPIEAAFDGANIWVTNGSDTVSKQ